MVRWKQESKLCAASWSSALWRGVESAGEKNNFVYSFEFLAEGPVIKYSLPEKTKEIFINM